MLTPPIDPAEEGGLELAALPPLLKMFAPVRWRRVMEKKGPVLEP
jgi:hypothetical protein